MGKKVATAATTLVFVAAASPMAGCAMDTESSEAVTGEAESAFTESTCGTDYNTGSSFVEDTGYYPLCSGSGTFHVSADGNYTDTDCTNAFRVKFDNPPVTNSHVQASWQDGLPTTQTACNNSYVAIRTYDSSGNLLSSTTQYAGWIPSVGLCVTPSPSVSGTNVALATATARLYSCGLVCGYTGAKVGVQMSGPGPC